MSLELVGFPDHFNHDQFVFVNPERVTAVYKEGDYTVIRLTDGSQPAVDAPVRTVAKGLTGMDDS